MHRKGDRDAHSPFHIIAIGRGIGGTAVHRDQSALSLTP
jgi:hypothetical protein